MRKLKLITLLTSLIINGVALADLNTGLMAYYNFDDCTAKDITGNGYDGVMTGNLDCVDGIGNNKAFRFKGNEYITTSYQQTNTTAYSISVWVKIGKKEGGGIVDNRGNEGSDATSLTLVSMSNSPIYSRYTTNFGVHGDEIAIGKSSTKVINDNLWHHLVGTWTAKSGSAVINKQFNLFIDGIKISTSTNIGSATSPLFGADYTTIGYYKAWSNFFKGTIDDVRIYSRVLNGTEVMTLYNQNKPFAILNGTINRLSDYTVTCLNNTTQQSIIVPISNTIAYDCEQKGLQVKPLDNVTITINGNVQ